MNTPQLPILDGAAVTLRPITDADTDLIVKWRNTPSVVQNFIFRQTFTPEMHRSWLATKVATGQVVQYIIVDKADGKPVGSVYYRDIDPHNRSAEYGIFIGEESARGKGLGTETARLFTDFGFAGLHLHRISLRVLAENTAARRSYEKASSAIWSCWTANTGMLCLWPAWRRRNDESKTDAKSQNVSRKDPQCAALRVGGSRVPCGILLPDQPHPAEQNLAAHHDEQRRSAL